MPNAAALRRIALPIALLLLPLPACGSGDRIGDAGAAVIRDSAGITIVENRAPGRWTGTDGWGVSAEPGVEIGALEGEPEYQLHRVRGAVRLSDGRIVVANAGTNELRAYSPDGRHLWTAGGEGGGPGEFEAMQMLERILGDTLLVYDWRQRRVSVFTGDGDFVRGIRIDPPGLFLAIAMALDDGTLVGQTRRAAEGGPSEAIRDTLLYHLVSADGEPGPTLGRFPDGEQVRRVRRQGDRISVSSSSLPFARWSYAAANRDRIAAGTTDRWEIRLYGPDGTLERLIRRPDLPPRESTADLFDRLIEYRIATLDEMTVRGPRPEPAEIRETLRALPRVPTLPAFSGLAVDDAGNLWVRTLVMPWNQDAPVEWSVYDPDGRLLGTVAVPAGLQVTHIADDAIVGTARDDLDVQYVRVHTLRKGGD